MVGKKNKRFLDLSDDELSYLENKEISNKKEKISEISQFQKQKDFKKNDKNFIKPNNEEDLKLKKDVKILDGLIVVQKDPSLDKGVHFYTERRIYEKLRNFSKKNGVSISKLLSTIIDKAISDDN